MTADTANSATCARAVEMPDACAATAELRDAYIARPVAECLRLWTSKANNAEHPEQQAHQLGRRREVEGVDAEEVERRREELITDRAVAEVVVLEGKEEDDPGQGEGRERQFQRTQAPDGQRDQGAEDAGDEGSQ